MHGDLASYPGPLLLQGPPGYEAMHVRGDPVSCKALSYTQRGTVPIFYKHHWIFKRGWPKKGEGLYYDTYMHGRGGSSSCIGWGLGAGRIFFEDHTQLYTLVTDHKLSLEHLQAS